MGYSFSVYIAMHGFLCSYIVTATHAGSSFSKHEMKKTLIFR